MSRHDIARPIAFPDGTSACSGCGTRPLTVEGFSVDRPVAYEVAIGDNGKAVLRDRPDLVVPNDPGYVLFCRSCGRLVSGEDAR